MNLPPLRLGSLLLGAALAGAAPAQQQDADALLAGMSVRDKAGQLFMSWILAKADGQAQARQELQRSIAGVGLGGVILSLGPVADAAALVLELQAASKLPLLCAGDFEGGVAARFAGATDMGNQMLVGATGLVRLARAMGEVTGREAKALGCHFAFAPVLDVNSNPDNPIINVRSFGEDPAAVARLGAAFAAGVRSQGVLPCGKHFPGHGDVSTDSHLQLPTVPGDSTRLHAVELQPFARAAAEGLEAVMTGHLAVPGLGEDAAVPATLSPRILGQVLRRELGFTGLIVTDALDMGGVKNALPPGEVAVRALLAGADVLLMPPDPFAARDAVVDAVASGRVPPARLDDAVRRILQQKQRLGLLRGGGRQDPDWRAVVAAPAHAQVADEIASRGITLVQDRQGLLPLGKGAPLLLLQLQEQDAPGTGAVFAAVLRERLGEVVVVRLHGGSSTAAVAAAQQQIASQQRLVLALHVGVRAYAGVALLPPALLSVVAALRPEQAVTAVSFGNPYLARQLPTVGTYLCAYASLPRLERAAALALLGEVAVTGRLPVSIPAVAAVGTGLSWYPGADVPRSAPEQEGLAADLPARITVLLQQAVSEQAFPGAVCLLAARGRLVAEVAVGRQRYDAAAPAVTPATVFDLASLTKVCATLPTVLALVAQQQLALDDPVQKWLPEFTGAGKEHVTLRHLLLHGSGLPASVPYYRTLQGNDAIVAAAAHAALTAAPPAATVYSDLGFLLLAAVVERCSGRPFAAVASRETFAALGMRGARFVAATAPAIDAAPTEDDPARGGVVQGRVHDENAAAMGGIAGHAGLFGTADDVLRLGLCCLGGGRGVLPRPLVTAATTPPAGAPQSTRALGFELPAAGGWAGSRVPAGTFGHTGFTGTSLWCDPQHDLCVVLLTNRVHPSRANTAIKAVRRALHDLVLQALPR